jgi:hypothetical protein
VGDIYLATQSKPSTPASGNGVLFLDTTLPRPFNLDDAGRFWGRSHNASINSQGAGFSADTYVTDSDLLIPSFGVQARTIFRWTIAAVKTAAGVATPVYSFRIGSARTTADTAQLQITGPAQTAAADNGILTLILAVLTVGGSGTIRGTAAWSHSAAATGFAADDNGYVSAASSGFDNSALGGQYVGVSINGGASASWTIRQVVAEAIF